MRKNPVSCNAFSTGGDRWRSLSVSALCSWITGAIRRASSMRVASGLNYILFSIHILVHFHLIQDSPYQAAPLPAGYPPLNSQPPGQGG
jgi:hypothetical protein